MVDIAEQSCRLPDDLAPLAERVVAALRKEAEQFTAVGATPGIELQAVWFQQVTDPSNNQPGYEGVWRNANKELCGSIIFNSDGSFYAEYDLFCQHPRDSRWFIEMVTAWGSGARIYCEAVMQPCM